jgi:hypothetical protein
VEGCCPTLCSSSAVSDCVRLTVHVKPRLRREVARQRAERIDGRVALQPRRVPRAWTGHRCEAHRAEDSGLDDGSRRERRGASGAVCAPSPPSPPACIQRLTSRSTHPSSGVYIRPAWLPRGGPTLLFFLVPQLTLLTHACDAQVLKYKLGQEYQAHFDYFFHEEGTANGGNRMATVLLYLNTPDEGGETVFPIATPPKVLPRSSCVAECLTCMYAASHTQRLLTPLAPAHCVGVRGEAAHPWNATLRRMEWLRFVDTHGTGRARARLGGSEIGADVAG